MTLKYVWFELNLSIIWPIQIHALIILYILYLEKLFRVAAEIISPVISIECTTGTKEKMIEEVFFLSAKN